MQEFSNSYQLQNETINYEIYKNKIQMANNLKKPRRDKYKFLVF